MKIKEAIEYLEARYPSNGSDIEQQVYNIALQCMREALGPVRKAPPNGLYSESYRGYDIEWNDIIGCYSTEYEGEELRFPTIEMARRWVNDEEEFAIE